MKQFIRDTENFNKFENQLGREFNSIYKTRRVRDLKTKKERVQKDLSLPNQKQKEKKGF
jgi:hypothetical protein